jgi:hypothetical protein
VFSKLLRITVCLGVFGAVFLTGMSSAGTKAETKVTIRAFGSEPIGTVKSPRPGLCANGRKVIVFKQRGAEQDPRTDDRVGSDTAERHGDVYQWSIGQPGVFGRMYARAPQTPDCKADSSQTIRIRQTT